MNVSIYQAGHERAASEIDCVRVLGSQRFSGYFPYQFALNEDVLCFRTISTLTVKYSGVGQQQWLHAIHSCEAMSR